jgi:hypothetical protein
MDLGVATWREAVDGGEGVPGTAPPPPLIPLGLEPRT